MDTERLIELGEAIHDAMVDTHHRGEAEWSDDLSGGCAVGSWLLLEEAKKELGMDLEFVCSGGHAWNEFEGHIFDVTATQYGVFEKVFTIPRSDIGSMRDSWHRAMYLSVKRSDIEHVNDTWPKGQQPKNFQIEWLGKNKARVIHKGRNR